MADPKRLRARGAVAIVAAVLLAVIVPPRAWRVIAGPALDAGSLVLSILGGNRG